MGTTAISLAQPNFQKSVQEEDKPFTRYWVQFFLKWLNCFQLITQDTTAGPVTVTLPPASTAPNYEVFAIKISADVNAFTLAAAGTDLINKQGAWAAATLAVGTAQGAAARLKSDGNSQWYFI